MTRAFCAFSGTRNFCYGFLACVILPGYVFSYTEDVYKQRIFAHLLIQDPLAACEEAQEALDVYPHSRSLHFASIQAFAKAGEEHKMWLAWKDYEARFAPAEDECHELAECMAWGVICKGATSSSPIIRIITLLAALFSQDAKGIPLLQKSTHDTNTYVRGAAVRLIGNLRDACLQDEVVRLLRHENNWRVRLEAIKAAGKMRLKAVQGDLIALASDPSLTAEETVAAVQSLVHIFDKTSDKLQPLADSPRAGLRILACELAADRFSTEAAPLLLTLLNDKQASVRAAALYALGVMRIQEALVPAKHLLDNPDPTVAILAAWLVTIHEPDAGQKAFSRLLTDSHEDTRRYAAAALAATGKQGFPLTRQAFQSTDDLYVRLNLALGLIARRTDVPSASQALYLAVTEHKERWMFDEHFPFRCLLPSNVKHDEMIPHYPEAVNRQVRLEILNVLAILKYPRAQNAIKLFLQEADADITGMASVVLLTEGDDDAIAIVTALMSDPDPKIRVQAALILAMWGAGEDASVVLEEAYGGEDREMKEKILEGIGRVGSKRSIPFLIDKLQEPPQALRLIAASSLLQSLYH